MKEAWRLRGYDPFSSDWYEYRTQAGALEEYASQQEAEAAAALKLAALEREQPSASSGGQGGIQDRIYVVRPDGTLYRYGVPPATGRL
jgi:hypothetical protein